MKKKSGSIFFIMMVLLMGIAIILYTSLRNASYLISLAREREKSEQRYYEKSGFTLFSTPFF